MDNDNTYSLLNRAINQAGVDTNALHALLSIILKRLDEGERSRSERQTAGSPVECQPPADSLEVTEESKKASASSPTPSSISMEDGQKGHQSRRQGSEDKICLDKEEHGRTDNVQETLPATEASSVLQTSSKKKKKLDDKSKKLKSADKEVPAETASPKAGSDSTDSHEQRQIPWFMESLQQLQEDIKQLKAEPALTEEKKLDGDLKDQLDDLQGKVESLMLSLTSQPSGSLVDKAGKSARPASPQNIKKKLERLLKRYKHLQEAVKLLVNQQTEGQKESLEDSVTDEAPVQLRTDNILHEDHQQTHHHIQALYKKTEELEKKKADKDVVEIGLKQKFDSVTEQLNVMFYELLDKVIYQEQNWQKIMDRLSTEMESKLNMIEFDALKTELKALWEDVFGRLQALEFPEDNACGFRKQLLDSFYCLSCDNPVEKLVNKPLSVKPPLLPAFPARETLGPFTSYGKESLRRLKWKVQPGEKPKPLLERRKQVQRENMLNPTSCADLVPNRLPPLPRARVEWQSAKAVSQKCESLKHFTKEDSIQFTQATIVGRDGSIYKGTVSQEATEGSQHTSSARDVKSQSGKDRGAAASTRPQSCPLRLPPINYSPSPLNSSSNLKYRPHPPPQRKK